MSDAAALERCIAEGGVVVFGADTVYGLACDPDNATAVRRLYALKGRAPERPAAVMFFDVERALAGVPELGLRTRAAAERILPGRVTLLVANPARRFPLACGPDPHTLGLRVPDITGLKDVARPVLQSSANRTGEPDARRLDDVPVEIRDRADLVLDAGELPGTASTVVDLREFERGGSWAVIREGAVSAGALADALDR